MKYAKRISEKTKPVYDKTLAPVVNWYHRYLGYSIITCMWVALILDVIIESLSRGSLKGCWSFVKSSPQVFFYNSLIILATLSVILLVKRRIFLGFVISTVWLGLGITNGIILASRTTPFTTADITLLETGLGVIPNYLSREQIIAVVAGIGVLLILYVFLFLFAPKCKKYSLRNSVIIIVVVAASTVGATQAGLSHHWLSTIFGNLGYAYKDYGFAYCFINTWLNTGVGMPDNYSEAKMLGILDATEKGDASEVGGLLASEQRTPNIIMLQLESFFDPGLVRGLEMSEDPIPNFHALQEEFSTGYLLVPSIGAGTANTEFEALTGMRIRFFGPGEYPYKTVLKNSTVETINYNLKELGYKTHALHNHRGAFYGRNQVFANLGFDTFTSLEYMINATMNPRNWAKDEVLTEEIMNALTSTEEPDMIYAISVQGHGQYPTKKVYAPPVITVEAIENEKEKIAFEYYINQIHEMDIFIGELIEALSEFEEETVLVMYGDHLPSLGLSDETVANGNIFETEYIIWSNFKMRKIDTSLKSYQLAATVLGRLGIDNGIITKFHQTQQGKGSYLTDLKALQYDMLYGKKYVYGGGEIPYEPTKLKMGIKDIIITEALEIQGHKYIKGESFTRYSIVTIEGNMIDTVYLDERTLRIPDTTDISDLSTISITQVDKNNTILSTNME